MESMGKKPRRRRSFTPTTTNVTGLPVKITLLTLQAESARACGRMIEPGQEPVGREKRLGA
jgi:hypothetical protein